MGEDTEYGQRARDLGLAIAYVPDALVYHLIPAARTTRRKMIHRFYQSGYSQPLFQPYDAPLFRTLGSYIKTSAMRLGALLFAGEHSRQMKLLCDIAQHSGRVAQILRKRYHD